MGKTLNVLFLKKPISGGNRVLSNDLLNILILYFALYTQFSFMLMRVLTPIIVGTAFFLQRIRIAHVLRMDQFLLISK